MRRNPSLLLVPVVLLVGFAAFLRSLDREPDLPEEERSDELPRLPVDLLALVDPDRDSVVGSWTRADGALIVPSDEGARLQIPYLPGEAYDLQVVVERKGGNGSLNFGLAQGGTQFMAVLDADPGSGYKHGVHLVDGKPVQANPTTRTGRLLLDGKPATLLCRVRGWGLEVYLDGTCVISWKDGCKRLSMEPYWKVPRTDILFIGGWEGSFRISELVLTPVSGNGRLLYPAGGNP